MSLYRKSLQDGVLVRRKRSMIMFWRWMYNACLEDPLTKVRNELFLAQAVVRRCKYLIPRLEAALKKEKDNLLQYMLDHNTTGGAPWRDTWRPRTAPTQDKSLYHMQRAKKKNKQENQRRKPPVLAQITLPEK